MSPPVLLSSKRTATVRQLDPENAIIGFARDLSVKCSMARMPFESGDRLIMYTDGLTEMANGAGEFLGVEGLRRTFRDTAHLSLEDSVSGIFDRVEAFSDGSPAADDQLLLALGFLGGGVPGLDGMRSDPGGR